MSERRVPWFDTLEACCKLTDAGFTDAQAKALVKLLVEAAGDPRPAKSGIPDQDGQDFAEAINPEAKNSKSSFWSNIADDFIGPLGLMYVALALLIVSIIALASK